ncbi:MAG: GNAT family N-acyltransferase, partial [Pseudomonadota bacterium]
NRMTAEAALLDKQNAGEQKFSVGLTTDLDEIRKAQQLRYQVFGEEMGAKLEVSEPGIDSDRYDTYCQHMVVRDNGTNEVIGCMRLLTREGAEQAGGFYSASEFEQFQNIINIPGSLMEVGRTCIHADYRNGAIMGLIWAGLAQTVTEQNIDYLMGCASVPLVDNRYNVVFDRLLGKYSAPTDMHIIPKVRLNREEVDATPAEVPALVKAYLRLGAQICGEPYWDADFKTADLFIVVDVNKRLQSRYVNHFFTRNSR